MSDVNKGGAATIRRTHETRHPVKDSSIIYNIFSNPNFIADLERNTDLERVGVKCQNILYYFNLYNNVMLKTKQTLNLPQIQDYNATNIGYIIPNLTSVTSNNVGDDDYKMNDVAVGRGGGGKYIQNGGAIMKTNETIAKFDEYIQIIASARPRSRAKIFDSKLSQIEPIKTLLNITNTENIMPRDRIVGTPDELRRNTIEALTDHATSKKTLADVNAIINNNITNFQAQDFWVKLAKRSPLLNPMKVLMTRVTDQAEVYLSMSKHYKI